MALTKQDFQVIRGIVSTELDSRFKTHIAPVRQDVGDLKIGLVIVERNIEELRNDVRGLREQIQQLTITLDNFVKMMTDYKEEFTILKAEVDQIKRVFKEKFGVEIAAQR